MFQLPNQLSVELLIPERRPYRLEETAGFSPLVLWAPHFENSEELLIHTFERLFFSYKSLYIRDLKVNDPTEGARISKLLQKPDTPLSASMHYVSSGELRAGATLQDFFFDSCGKRARLSSGADVTGRSQNLIIMGA